MDKKDELIEDKREPYTQPLLTRHEPLRALTGKSGEKDPIADKDPQEKGNDGKDPILDKNPDEKGADGKEPIADKDPNEKDTDGPAGP